MSLRKQLWVWAAVCIAPALTIGLILYAHISANHRSSQREMMGLRYARVVWDVVAMVTDVVYEGNQADRARVLDGRLQAAHADYGGKIDAEPPVSVSWKRCSRSAGLNSTWWRRRMPGLPPRRRGPSCARSPKSRI